MGFINLFLLLLALFELSSSISVKSIQDPGNVTANSSTFGVLAAGDCSLPSSIGMGNCRKRFGKKHLICIQNPKFCSTFSEHHTCCYNHFCVDISTNPFHCGFCGHACNHGMTCCEGVCVDSRKDRNHCGRCREVCDEGESCVFGMCGYG